MNSNKSLFDTFNLQTLHNFAAEMDTGRRSYHCPLVFGEYRLITVDINLFGLPLYIFGKRRGTKPEEIGLEFLMTSVVEESQGASARGCVVDYLGHHRFIVAEIKFVAYSDLAGRLDKNVPKFMLRIEFAQEENLNAGAGFLLIAKQTGRKHFGIIKHHHISLIEEPEDIAKSKMLDFATFAMNYHKLAVAAFGRRILSYQLFGQFVFELGKLHFV